MNERKSFTAKWLELFNETLQSETESLKKRLVNETLRHLINENKDVLPLRVAIFNGNPYLFLYIGEGDKDVFFLHGDKFLKGMKQQDPPNVISVIMSSDDRNEITGLMENNLNQSNKQSLICPPGFFPFRFKINKSVGGYDVPDQERTAVLEAGSVEKAMELFAEIILRRFSEVTSCGCFQVWLNDEWHDVVPLVNGEECEKIFPGIDTGIDKKLSFALAK